jgi:CheY-like chemotaxis protein
MPQTQYIVYLVDDDEDDLEMLTSAFHKVNCVSDVQCYKTNAGLIWQLNTLPFAALPDLIVMDHHMPPYGEGELVRYIRSQKKLDFIALIIYTTILKESIKPSMLHDGVDGMMIKGNTMHEIEENVDTFCRIIAEKKLTVATINKKL